GLFMQCAGHRSYVMVHGGLCEVDLQLPVQVRGEPAAWRVAANLVCGGPGGGGRGGPADGRWPAAPVVLLGRERGSGVAAHAPALGGLDRLRAGYVHGAAELQEIDIVDRDCLPGGQEPPERAACWGVCVPAR